MTSNKLEKKKEFATESLRYREKLLNIVSLSLTAQFLFIPKGKYSRIEITKVIPSSEIRYQG